MFGYHQSKINLKFIAIVSILFFTICLFFRTAQVNGARVLNTARAVSDSYVKTSANSRSFYLYTPSGALYQTNAQGQAAAQEFIQSDPQFQGTSINPTHLLPNNFSQQSNLIKSLNDQNDQYLLSHGFHLNDQHYYYSQNIGGVPVFGAVTAVHVAHGNQVYALSGNLITNETIGQAKISDNQARQIGLNQASLDAGAGVSLQVVSAVRYVFNQKLLGLSDDDKNYLTLAVTINSTGDSARFSHQYFVDLESSQILHSVNLIEESLYRKIYNCAGGGNCPLVRQEGGAAVGDGDIDNTYDILGAVYNYYFGTYNRDNYDNNSGTITKGLVHIPNSPTFPCPNAAWVGSGYNQMQICNGMVARDVIGHEMNHAVDQYTANLHYSNQSGALNEGFADIFGYAIDPNNWTMGENTVLGVIRHLDDSTKNNPPNPDRLFSSNYYCGSSDNGGVHANMTIATKAFYLMTAGGNFNGCSITGISKEKSLPIMYRTLTTTLKQGNGTTETVENYKDWYNAVSQACGDLYGATSDTCNQVKNAMQSTEIDQQPDTQQNGAKCLNRTRQTPACAGAGTTPTVTPTAAATPTAAPTPTTNPNCSCQSNQNCKSTCTFDRYPDVTYANPIKCSREQSIPGPTPGASYKNSYCDRSERTKADADGNGVVNNIDYLFYVTAVNGGSLPVNVDADFNGDGKVSPTDRAIIVRTLGI